MYMHISYIIYIYIYIIVTYVRMVSTGPPGRAFRDRCMCQQLSVSIPSPIILCVSLYTPTHI